MQKVTDRDKKVGELLSKGWTLQKIAESLKVSRQRVHQIKNKLINLGVLTERTRYTKREK